MARALAPATEADLADIIASGGAFAVQGTGMRGGLGRALPDLPVLSLAKFTGIESYEPEELVLEAGAGSKLADIQKLLASKQQMLAFEPPDFSHLWAAKHAGSLGGMLATALAGPRRIKAGSVRDHVLGVRGVSGRGEIFKAGARVVKNVTGYDMPKLMAGSFGTLAALTSVTFKVLPVPETEETVFIPAIDDVAAIRLMSSALQSSAEISGAAHLPGQGTYLRLDGIASSVAARRESLVRSLPQRSDVLDEKASRALWATVRDCKVFDVDETEALWRISITPSEGADIAKRISALTSARHYFDWGGGLLWVCVPGDGDAGAAMVRGAFTSGHAMLFKAPAGARASVPVFQPQSAEVAALTRRIKSAFDPAGKLNPSRMYEGV